MSKPEDIPQDVWEKAYEAAGAHSDPYARGSVTAVARAILAAQADEREACAKIAAGEVYHNDRFRTWPWWKPQPDGTRGNRSNESDIVRHSDEIAATIRNRGEARS